MNRNITSLHLGDEKGIEKVSLLIDQGANINVKDNYGNTTLHLAVKHNIEIIKLLFEKKEYFNMLKNFERSDIERAELFIKKGGDIMVRDLNGCTLLDRFVKIKRIELVILLCRYQRLIDISKKDALVEYIADNIDTILASKSSDLNISVSALDNILRMFLEKPEKVINSIKTVLLNDELKPEILKLPELLTLYLQLQSANKFLGLINDSNERKTSEQKLFSEVRTQINVLKDHISKSLDHIFDSQPKAPINKMLGKKDILEQCLHFLDMGDIKEPMTSQESINKELVELNGQRCNMDLDEAA